MKHAKHTKHANFLKYAKHAILWSTPSTPFHGARQAFKYVKHAKLASMQSTPARQTREHASTPFSRLSTFHLFFTNYVVFFQIWMNDW